MTTHHTSGAADRCQACFDRNDGFYGSYAPKCHVHNDDGTPRATALTEAQQPALTAQAISVEPAGACTAELRRLHAELETLPVGYINRGIAPHTKGKTVFHEKPTTNLEERWWSRDEPVFLASQGQAPALDRDRIREIFMAHGFTVKEGQTDLKQYVYDAAEALLRASRAPADSVLEDAIKVLRADLKTSAKEIADEYAEDAARWQALPAFFEEYQIDAMKLYRDIDAAIDATRKQGANHDNT